MTHEAALLTTLRALLTTDSVLVTAGKGAFFDAAPTGILTPFLVYRPTAEHRENTLGGEAVRTMAFMVRSHFADADGANYANGHTLWKRALWLLDGKARDEFGRQRMAAIVSALNGYFEPLGYRCLYCALEVALPVSGNAIPPAKVSTSYSMGGVFHLKLRPSVP